MKQVLAVVGLAVLTLVVLGSVQVVKGPSGLAITGGHAMAADLGQPYTKAPPPPPPEVGKGKAPIIGKGKGKAPVVTTRD
jgi:hypothetical protein